MARCKMDQPERAAYLRVFCAHLLTDEDFETLTREEMGSACLLMFHAWTKQGSLPNDEKRLAGLARCSVEEFRAFRKTWPKLVPLETLDPSAEPEERVTIPYLWREWMQVMEFYEAQREKSRQGVAARKAAASGAQSDLSQIDEPTGIPMGSPMGNPTGDPTGDPTGIPYQDQDQDQDQDQEKKKKETSPSAPGYGQVLSVWNEVTNGKLPKARITPKRQNVIRTRLKEPGWFDDFGEACVFLAGSKWHQGENDRGWIASIDFALQSGKATEIAERARLAQGGKHGNAPNHRFTGRDEALKRQLAKQPPRTPLPEVWSGDGGAPPEPF